jgi:hypothetical protein
MPAHHDVRPKDVFARRLHATLAAAAEQGPIDFADLLSPGVGARTVQSLAMVAEVLHGAPFPFRDPARFSLAHGGKDRHRDTDIPVCARSLIWRAARVLGRLRLQSGKTSGFD